MRAGASAPPLLHFSRMHRVLIPPHAVRGGEITVTDPGDLHHLLDVLRVGIGDRLECFDGAGRNYAGRILRSGRQAVTIAIDERTEEPPLRLAITLAQALIKPEPFEWVIQKATELGVTQILPTLTSRTRVRVSPGTETARMKRWRRIAEAAAAQCGRASLPSITEPQPFEEALKAVGSRCALLPTLAEQGDSLERLAGRVRQAGDVIVLIGPEGDFSPEEVALAKRCGAQPVTLGRATLKSETAAIATLAILQHLVGAL